MNRRILLYFSIILLLPTLSLSAQDKKPKLAKDAKVFKGKTVIERSGDLSADYPNSYLDTVQVGNIFVLNDYTTFGFEYGVNLNRMTFNPAYTQDWHIAPDYYEFSMTRYGKLFGYMPYFGLKVSLAYGHQGYKFKENRETHTTAVLEGASEVDYTYCEVPIMSAFHIDMPYFKISAEVGPYAGYRLGIDRIGDRVKPEDKNTFLDYDNRFDYGLKGGAGFAIVLSPFEFFVNGKLRYSLNPVFEPDHWSPYYYRYAYPFDVMVTAGVQFQITKRTGKTKGMLKKEAKQIVNERYNGTPSNNR